MTATASFIPAARLQSKEGICAYLGGISTATYDSWHAKGIVPGPVRGTNRYDVKAHDLALDRRGGLEHTVSGGSTLENWERSHAA
tara:strand:+ start:41459 stop:41713 length:255 start_codon:yes stop_codon:yes gene_type:complete